MNLKEATERACQEPSLLDALVWIAVWENERAIQQAKEFFETGKRGPDGQGWDTCFGHCFQSVIERWRTNNDSMPTL